MLRVRTRRAKDRRHGSMRCIPFMRASFVDSSSRASVDDGDRATRPLGVRAMSGDASVLRRERGADGDRVGGESREIRQRDDDGRRRR